MAPKSSKNYRQKHKELYREIDALRKGNYGQKMKANPIANEERLRVQPEKKQKYWRRVFKESIATAAAANLAIEQNDDSAFSQAHIRSRSIRKVAETLPKIPRKR